MSDDLRLSRGLWCKYCELFFGCSARVTGGIDRRSKAELRGGILVSLVEYSSDDSKDRRFRRLVYVSYIASYAQTETF